MPGNDLTTFDLNIDNKILVVSPNQIHRFIINVYSELATTLCAPISQLSIKRFSIASSPMKSTVKILRCSTTGINKVYVYLMIIITTFFISPDDDSIGMRLCTKKRPQHRHQRRRLRSLWYEPVS